MGAYTVAGLPFGSYFVVAAPALPAGDDAWQDPQFLESLTDRAVLTSLTEGQSITADLRVVAP